MSQRSQGRITGKFSLFSPANSRLPTVFHLLGATCRQQGVMFNSTPPIAPEEEELLDEPELAARLKTSVESVRWMRRSGRISFIKIAGNRKVRFRWPQVLEDLRAAEVRAAGIDDERSRQLADIAETGDDDNAEVSRDELERRSFDHRDLRLPCDGKLTWSLLCRLPAGAHVISLTTHGDGSSVFTGQVGEAGERHRMWAAIREAGADQRNCHVTMDGSVSEAFARPFPTDPEERDREIERRGALLNGPSAPTGD